MKYKYLYVGRYFDFWDGKGKTVINATTPQSDLAYLYGKVDGVVRIEVKSAKGD